MFDAVFAQGDLGLNSGGVGIFPLCGLDVGDRLIIPREEKWVGTVGSYFLMRIQVAKAISDKENMHLHVLLII